MKSNECKQDFEDIQLQKVFDPFMYNPQAQSDNMELMDACLEKNVRLIDYERMCDESGNYFYSQMLLFSASFFFSFVQIVTFLIIILTGKNRYIAFLLEF